MLRGWSIEVQHDLVYDSRVKSIDVSRKRAVVLTGSSLPTEECDSFGVPLDYAVHEVLHIAWAAAGALDPKEGEEILVQDLADLLTWSITP